MSMITFLVTLSVFLLVVGGMSIGLILQNKPIKGSCGGMSSLGIDTACDICGGDASKCDEEQERKLSENAPLMLAYDASSKK